MSSSPVPTTTCSSPAPGRVIEFKSKPTERKSFSTPLLDPRASVFYSPCSHRRGRSSPSTATKASNNTTNSPSSSSLHYSFPMPSQATSSVSFLSKGLCNSRRCCEPDQTPEEDQGEILPLEVLALILRFCDAKTVIRCSQVCCSLYSLSKDESLWRRLYIKDFLSASNSNNTVNIGLKNISGAPWRERYARHYLLAKYGTFREKSVVRCDYGLSYEVVNFHSESNCLICRSEVFKNLHIFSVPTNSSSPVRTHILGGRDCPIFCAASNGQYVAGGSSQGVIYVWIPEHATLVTELKGHTDKIISLRFCDDKLASGSNDGSVKVWSTSDWSCLFTLREENLYPIKLNSNVAGDLLVCASLDFTCRVWDLMEMRSIHVVDESDDVWIAQVEVTQSCVVLLYFLDKKVTIWNVRTGESKILCHPRSVRCIAANESASILISGGYDGCLRFWNIETGTCFKCNREAHGKRSIDFVRCNEWKAVTASAAGLSTDIKVWDVKSGNCLQTVKSHASLDLSMPNRTEVGIVSDLFFGSDSIITISNEEANMRFFALDIQPEKRSAYQKQLSMFIREGVPSEDEAKSSEEGKKSKKHLKRQSSFCGISAPLFSRHASTASTSASSPKQPMQKRRLFRSLLPVRRQSSTTTSNNINTNNHPASARHCIIS